MSESVSGEAGWRFFNASFTEKNMDKYTFKKFEVIEENTHKYSSTSVNSFGTDRITSTTTHHSKQTIWLKNTDTNQEEQLNLPTEYNVPARSGHKILCAYDQTGNLAQIQNITTGHSKNFINDPRVGTGNTFFFSILIFIPFAQALYAAYCLFSIIYFLLNKIHKRTSKLIINYTIVLALFMCLPGTFFLFSLAEANHLLCSEFVWGGKIHRHFNYLMDEYFWYIYLAINALIAYRSIKSELIKREMYLEAINILESQTNQFIKEHY